MTTQSPDEAEIPTDALEFFSKSDYWMLRNNQAYNSDSGVMLNFDINSLSVGQSVGLSVTSNGKLSFYVDGKFNNIVWRGLPTGMKYWGVKKSIPIACRQHWHHYYPKNQCKYYPKCY